MKSLLFEWIINIINIHLVMSHLLTQVQQNCNMIIDNS